MSSLPDTFDVRSSRLLFTLVIAGLLAVWTPVHAQHPTAVTSIVNSAQDTTLLVTHSGGLLMPGKGQVFTYAAPGDSIPAEGVGTRMMWYPEKAAFRAGEVSGAHGTIQDTWDADNIGWYSVAFGEGTQASGYSSAALGIGTTASGYAALAMGAFTTASGNSAMAMGEETRASGKHSTAMGLNTKAATGKSLSIGEWNDTNLTDDNSLFVAGNGSGSSSRSDALVLDNSGNLAIEGTFTDDLGTFAGHFQVSKAAADRAGHAVLVENGGGDGSDALAVQTGLNTNPGGSSNFITFYDGDGTPIGSIEGDGSGGITTLSGSADFAEELPVRTGEDAPDPASLVGVTGGAVTLETEGAERVMITSTAPIMTGNATTEMAADDDRRVAVAFVGQVPAKVRGPAEVGDLIVPSGRNDGTALAVAPDEYRRSTHGPIAGQAWSEKSAYGVGEVTVAVGLGHSGAVADRLTEQQRQIDELQTRVQQIKTLQERVVQLEASSNDRSVLAGLPGSGLLLGLLLGGLLGAGLLWRRQDG